MTTSTALIIKSPTVVATETAAIENAIATLRSRPVVAINELGELVVCCRSTARKHGWSVEGKLYFRTRSTSAAPKATGKMTREHLLEAIGAAREKAALINGLQTQAAKIEKNKDRIIATVLEILA